MKLFIIKDTQNIWALLLLSCVVLCCVVFNIRPNILCIIKVYKIVKQEKNKTQQ